MKKLLILIIILMMKSAAAQSIFNFTVSTGGVYVSNGGYSLSQTLGELTLVETFSGGSLMLTQGFQQPYENAGFLPVEDFAAPGAALDIFPVPATDVLNIDVKSDELKSCQFEVYTVLGQATGLTYHAITGNGDRISRQMLDLRSLSPGFYFIRVKLTGITGVQSQVIKRFEVLR